MFSRQFCVGFIRETNRVLLIKVLEMSFTMHSMSLKNPNIRKSI